MPTGAAVSAAARTGSAQTGAAQTGSAETGSALIGSTSAAPALAGLALAGPLTGSGQAGPILLAAVLAATAAGLATTSRAAAAARLGAGPVGGPGLTPLLRRPWFLPALAAVSALALLGPVAAAFAGGASVVGRRALSAARRAGERERGAAAVVEACSVLAAELRAGRPPDAALALAAQDLPPALAGVLQRAVLSAGLGGDVGSALVTAAGEAGSLDSGTGLLRQLAACWRVAERTGAGLAGVVQALATDLRARERLRLETKAALAGPRTTAWLLAVLPLVGIAMAAGFGADPARVLLRTPVGLGCLVLGTVLDVLGLLWTRRLVSRVFEAR